MEPPSAGSVVLVPFPFSDLSRSKLRPAVILAETSRRDFVLCQVTSNPYADPDAIELTDESFTTGTLQKTSYARPGKLFTGNEELFEGIAGHLSADVHRQIIDGVVTMLRSGA
jgi:mRNA interferase MazF